MRIGDPERRIESYLLKPQKEHGSWPLLAHYT